MREGGRREREREGEGSEREGKGQGGSVCRGNLKPYIQWLCTDNLPAGTDQRQHIFSTFSS